MANLPFMKLLSSQTTCCYQRGGCVGGLLGILFHAIQVHGQKVILFSGWNQPWRLSSNRLTGDGPWKSSHRINKKGLSNIKERQSDLRHSTTGDHLTVHPCFPKGRGIPPVAMPCSFSVDWLLTVPQVQIQIEESPTHVEGNENFSKL